MNSLNTKFIVEKDEQNASHMHKLFYNMTKNISPMAFTHIVFVGHHKERLMESITRYRKHPVHRVILVTGDDDSTGERISRKVAGKVYRELSPAFEMSIVRVDKRDVMHAASQIVDLILADQAMGNTCILNISGSLRTYAIAAYIAGCLTRAELITSIPRYDSQDQEVGIEEIIELPLIPVQYPRKDQAQLLEAIKSSSGYFEELIPQVSPATPAGASDFSRERSRLTHHLKKIDEMGLIVKEKSGKNVSFQLSPLGEIFEKICREGERCG
jgi:CRISPR-associated protein Csa3